MKTPPYPLLTPENLARARRQFGAIRRKYRNRPTVVDGQRFDSKAEGRHWLVLRAELASGRARLVLRQVPFHLPGGVVYRVDFLVHRPDGRLELHEVKGMRTEAYRIKKRLVEALYGVVITEYQA